MNGGYTPSGGGSGDMTKGVYDPQNVGVISGLSNNIGLGGTLSMVGDIGTAGSVITNASSNRNGGNIFTYAANGNEGGNILTYGGVTAGGGSIDTHDGGGSINTRGTGLLQLGENGTRTTITGFATSNRAFNLPDLDCFPMVYDGGWAANGSTGDKTTVVANYSGGGIDGTMEAALNLVSAGLGTALVQDEARIRELINKLQAIESGLAGKLIPNQ